MSYFRNALRAYLETSEATQGSLAVDAGMSQAAINRYANGTRFPERAIAERISAASGGAVPMSEWRREAAERLGFDPPDHVNSDTSTDLPPSPGKCDAVSPQQHGEAA